MLIVTAVVEDPTDTHTRTHTYSNDTHTDETMNEHTNETNAIEWKRTRHWCAREMTLVADT